MKKTIRIATRKSRLAIWQAEFVKNALLKLEPNLTINLIGLTTKGDREPIKALSEIGGKQSFVKSLQNAILKDKADIAVHSMKDLSVHDSPELTLAAICKREDPRDAFISVKYQNIQSLPQNAVIGTASPRRMALLKSQRPDIQIKVLRGNVGTRLIQYQQKEYDGTLLAVAGLKRLKLEKQITEYLPTDVFIPAIGQGAIGVECRQSNTELIQLINRINHAETATCVNAERAVNRVLGGDCHTPIAAYAAIDDRQLFIRGMVGDINGKTILHSTCSGPVSDAIKLGQMLGEGLLVKGAAALL